MSMTMTMDWTFQAARSCHLSATMHMQKHIFHPFFPKASLRWTQSTSPPIGGGSQPAKRRASSHLEALQSLEARGKEWPIQTFLVIHTIATKPPRFDATFSHGNRSTIGFVRSHAMGFKDSGTCGLDKFHVVASVVPQITSVFASIVGWVLVRNSPANKMLFETGYG